MKHFDLISKEFSSGVRSYIRENLDNELLMEIIDHKSFYIPFLIRNGILAESLDKALQEGPESVYLLLSNFGSNKRESLNLTKSEILHVLEDHPLIKLKEKPSRVFLIGSFASGNNHLEIEIY